MPKSHSLSRAGSQIDILSQIGTCRSSSKRYFQNLGKDGEVIVNKKHKNTDDVQRKSKKFLMPNAPKRKRPKSRRDVVEADFFKSIASVKSKGSIGCFECAWSMTSIQSIITVLSIWSMGSVGCIGSIASSTSIASVGSVASILSWFSLTSVASLSSKGSMYSIGSHYSNWSIGSKYADYTICCLGAENHRVSYKICDQCLSSVEPEKGFMWDLN